MYGYYTKGNEIYIRTYTVTSVNTDEPVLLELDLPEGADKFAGVRTETSVEQLTETWTPDAVDMEALSQPSVYRFTFERCLGKVDTGKE